MDNPITTAKVMRMEEAFWELPPGHFQAFSKLLVLTFFAARASSSWTESGT